MTIIPEIEISSAEHDAITKLRNLSFPSHQVARSYYKQLPGYRFLNYKNCVLVGYMGLDYRVMSADGRALKTLGVIDFCVAPEFRGQGIGSSMLAYLNEYAVQKELDFLVLISEQGSIYRDNGFQNVETEHSWLRLHEHQNYGVTSEFINEFYVKPMSSESWPKGKVDWLGYMF